MFPSHIEVCPHEQGTLEWRLDRLGIPSASKFKDILAKGQGKTRSKYMRQLVGEIITGELSEGYKSDAMARGNEQEPEARAEYAFLRDEEPILVGFIKSNGSGCSPDFMINPNGSSEIKTSNAEIQISILLDGKMPAAHKPQVQGVLWKTEREWCDFVNYCRGLPLFVQRIYRDEEYITMLAGEVSRFIEEMHELELKIRAM